MDCILDYHNISVIGLDKETCIKATELLPIHRDPCDRFIIATALLKKMPVVTTERRFAKYGVEAIGQKGEWIFQALHFSSLSLTYCSKSLIMLHNSLMFSSTNATWGHATMGNRKNLHIPEDKIAEFCQKNGIRKLSLFGSVLRDDFKSDSDVDIIVEFEEGARVGMI